MENKFTPNFSILVTIISNKPVDCHHFTLLAEVPSRGALRLGLADQASRRSAFCPPGLQGPEVFGAHPDSAGQLGTNGWARSALATSPLVPELTTAITVAKNHSPHP